MEAIDENTAKIVQFIAWAGDAINNVACLQDLINERLGEIQHEQARQARVIAFIQRRQRAGGRLTRNLLAKQKRAMRAAPLRQGNSADHENQNQYQTWFDGRGVIHHVISPAGIPQLDLAAKARIRAELLAAVAGLSTAMSGEEEGSRRASETTTMRFCPQEDANVSK